MGFFGDFHRNGVFEKSLNATFISLIPKVAGAVDIKDFRPISLLGSVYKILAKVLASRLRKVVGKVVGHSQHAFIPGRQILDAVLIANECIDAWIKSGNPGILCKLDIEKAYDHVSWSFLLEILDKMRFPSKWRKWISFCISTVRFSILINGEPAGFFSSSRGLRQGDPLSPLLFILVMEALSKLALKAVEEGFLEGVKISNSHSEGVLISHLLFADDTLFFCKPNENNLGYLKCILLIFEAMSGLRVNLNKSVIIPIGEVPNVNALAQFFGCKVDYLPSSYLGLPLGASYKSKAVWDPLIERFHRRLAGWKAKLLSRGGRLTLLKSTLWSLPIYFMSLFTIPASIAHQLERIMRDFLWNSNSSCNGLHWVNWDEVCRPKQEGGLGIRPLRVMNEALKTKWLWRFAKEDNAMWKNVIKAKYGTDDLGWWSKMSSFSHGVGFWKSISACLERFKSLVHFEVKDGSRVLFWHDIWCGDHSLKTLFPSLFRMARHKNATVLDVVSWKMFTIGI
uniref:Reverse transcriptase domain-containing protein n=1 Tax=Opuntia streptacantha TaxID=393608 RepID=A0A7C9AA13_OPUST